MCGIAGIYGSRLSPERMDDVLLSMGRSILHRGPDDNGVWTDLVVGLGFCHQRLSIIDLSDAGHQPMSSVSGRYVIVFNGEIYNFKKLRCELEDAGYTFSGSSDTEVLLSAIECWGLPSAIKRCVGMFAFALWDKKSKSLTIARDRMGEKPLYYGWQGSTFLFGSELKTIFSFPDYSEEIDRSALSQFMQYSYVPAPRTIFKNIYKLPSGSYLTIACSVLPDNFSPYAVPEMLEGTNSPLYYWNPHEVVKAENRKLTISLDEAVLQLKERLIEAISSQMFADVPLGAFLSGGVDSSTIVALMQEISSSPVHTFTIGFKEKDYNEAIYAQQVADHIGTNHTELYVEPDSIVDLIPRIPEIYDEPFADSSQLPTYLVAEMTRQHVTVSLSGDGGDELFAGYNRYFWGQRLWSSMSRFPMSIRKLLPFLLTMLPPSMWDNIVKAAGTKAPDELRAGRAGDKIHKLAGVIGVNSPEEMYRRLISVCQNPERVVKNGIRSTPWNESQLPELMGYIEKMMYLDMLTYLPDDILVKNDRAAMAVSLETRMPFLDHRVVELAWQFPQKVKVAKGNGKLVLRELLYQYVPKTIIDRPKMGFGIPISTWLRGPLRAWAENLLSTDKLNNQGYFNVNEIRRKWDEHIRGKRNWQYFLWNVLIFQAWLEKWERKIKN